MYRINPGDAVATPRSRRSEHRSADADFAATAQRGELARTAQPLPTPCFEDSRAGRWLFAVLIVGSLAVIAWRLGWPA